MDVRAVAGSWRKRSRSAGGQWHALDFGSQGNEVTPPPSGFPKQGTHPTQALVTLPCLTYWSPWLPSHCVAASGVGQPIPLCTAMGEFKGELAREVQRALLDNGTQRIWDKAVKTQ